MLFFKRVLFTLYLLLCGLLLNAQNCEDKSIQIEKDVAYAVSDLLTSFTDQHGLIFSYSPSIVDLNQSYTFRKSTITWKHFLNKVIEDKYLDFLCDEMGKIIIYRTSKIRLQSKAAVRHYGIIYDSVSKEKLFGANVLLLDGNLVGVSDENGFYSIYGKVDSIQVQYLGYKTTTVAMNQLTARIDIALTLNNELTTVTISSTKVNDINDLEGDNGIINFKDNPYISGHLGDENGLNLIMQKPGVQVGSEGQTGLLIRGGTTDQNLYLYNGVPMYELSHVAGLSSVLQVDNIQNIELFKSGIPAKYGGRLSSVVNINTKNGHKTRIEGNIGMSLSSVDFHLEGPIVVNKLSFNVNLRQSTVGLYANPLIKNNIDYNDFNIDYGDLSLNLHYQIGKNDELNIFGYSGNDEVFLESKIDSINGNNSFSFTDRVALNWGTTLYGVEYQKIISNAIVLKAALSKSKYNISNRGSYLSNRLQSGISSVSELDIISSSSIQDQNLSILLDYYPFKLDKLSIGTTLYRHEFTPALIQSTLVRDVGIEEIIGDPEVYRNQEIGLFLDYKNHLLDYFKLNLGIRNMIFRGDDTRYSNWEPRLSVQSEISAFISTRLSYNKLSQSIHLLTNPGAGFPADLWVPSTADIRPEESEQWSASIEVKNRLIDYFSVSIFSKKFDHLLEYQGSEDVFFSIINEGNPTITFENNGDWARRLISGRGAASGWEVSFRQMIGNLSLDGAYSRLHSTRSFEAIDKGNAFPHRNDRPHDFKLNALWEMNDRWQAHIHFAFGSGATYSLALEEFITSTGDTIRVSNGRNLQRLPAFHHLDVYFRYSKVFQKKKIDFQFGIYNIYNRLNPFYVFLYQGLNTQDLRLRQVSLFPILPSVRLKYYFWNDKGTESRQLNNSKIKSKL